MQVKTGDKLALLDDVRAQAQYELASAELQEVQALVDYNNFIARFYQAQGTLLERNGIEFKDTAQVPGLQ